VNDSHVIEGDAVPGESAGAQDIDEAFLRAQRGPFLFAFLGAMAIVLLFWAKLPVSVGFDPNDEKCIPDMHLSLMVHYVPRAVHDGDLVFWAPRGELSYVKQRFVLKQVAAVQGDHVVIKDQKVFVNGVLRATGLPLAALYKRRADQLERDEVVPPGAAFVLGQHPRSDDSRYWGFVSVKTLDGVAYKLL
jgi:conjugal transfer pilin signal peptidase TrbI